MNSSRKSRETLQRREVDEVPAGACEEALGLRVVRRDPQVVGHDGRPRYRSRRLSRRSARTFPPVWHVGAVRDLVGLVAHAAQVVAAPRARLPDAVVHGEVVADLRRQPAVRARSASSASSRIRVRRLEQPLPLVGVELARATRTATASRGAGCRRCSRGRRRPPCAGRAGSCARGGRRRRGGTARRPRGSAPRGRARRAARRRRARAPTSRPCAPCRTPSPARSGRSSARIRSTEPRGFVDFGGDSTSTRPPCERWNEQPAGRRRGRRPRTSRGAPTRSIVRPSELRRAAARTSSARRTAACRARRASRPRSDLVEPLGERLDLRHLGHGSPSRQLARPPSRTISMHSSIRSRCVRWRHDADAQDVLARGSSCSTGTRASTR